MKILRPSAALVFLWLAHCNTANANDNFWFGVKAGTLGYGAEVSWRPIEWL